MRKRSAIFTVVLIIVVIIALSLLLFMNRASSHSSTIQSGGTISGKVNNVIINQAIEKASNVPDKMFVEVNITVSYNGSGSVNIVPQDFYLTTSRGVYEGSPGEPVFGDPSPFQPTTLKNETSANGIVSFLTPSNISLHNIYYKENGKILLNISLRGTNLTYFTWISVIHISSNNSLTVYFTNVSSNLMGFSGNKIVLNVTIHNLNYNETVKLMNLTVQPNIFNYTYSPPVGENLTIKPNGFLSLVLTIILPRVSYYGDVYIKITFA
ncbi:hypothetical protein [Sulfolobus acidocaldarius]|uniref:Uncharacterized protein n=3 Tax=Sulfolobus acidocaldarius TaxID=2285 RepID=A0A0U3GKP7_9CREN|nr:hypothetical protein [Sulfolobus acidocaldarius]AAY81036.1 hypothetical membrane protein [Sulfolobus acidocaldarius DSM 639]ALU30143.1 hypothetical protein ATY89_09480 [Sulfolobus acidocaldarius]ALU30837.1 hypothetical protein ATZ20_00890 [Sulfolobus acidocaldarius]WCM35544.1 hypothetical protein GO597_09480 [Sulfolobus acidocaldarius DSM 639]